MGGLAGDTTDDWEGELLAPLAAQWWPPQALRPEQRLLRAVLEEALAELAAGRMAAASPLDNRRRLELLDWFASHDRSWPCSFENVCDAIDLDPERVRGKLARLRAAALVYGSPRTESHRRRGRDRFGAKF
jgi:hypothetical protein